MSLLMTTMLQVLTIGLMGGETIHTEPGAMMHMSNDVGASLYCPGNCCMRWCCLGAGCCMTSYTNNGQDGYIGAISGLYANLYRGSESSMM